MGHRLTGEQHRSISRKIGELQRQIGQEGGYPHDPVHLDKVLQMIVDGRLGELGQLGLVVKLNIWKTINLGTGLCTADDFCQAMVKADQSMSDTVKEVMCKPAFTVSVKPTTIDLVVLNNTALGFPEGATVAQSYQRAKEMGLELCPPEVGPQLRLQHTRRNNGEWLNIAMLPIMVSDGSLLIFTLGDARGLWLLTNHGKSDAHYHGDTLWVFSHQ